MAKAFSRPADIVGMRIESSSIQLASSWSHQALQIERMQVRAADQPAQTQQPGPTPTGAGKSTAAAQASDDQTTELSPNDRLYLLKALLERLTGRPIRLMKAPEAPHSQVVQNEVSDGREPEPEIQYQRVQVVQDTLAFQAAGTVQTADGRSIRFRLAFALARSEVTIEQGVLRPSKDPLVLDFLDQGAALAGDPVAFDLHAKGSTVALPVPGSGRGYLIFDRNGNGQVDDGRELFGPTSGDGFAELAALDRDGNRWIDEADPAYSRLALWRPGNGLVSLTRAGIGALFTGSVNTPWSLNMGQAQSTGIYLSENGQAGTISRLDVFA